VEFTTKELEGGITLVILEGRMDIEGAASIDLKMNIVGGTSHSVLVDLQKVTYLGSVGISVLVAASRPIKNRGGKFAFLGPIPLVAEVLRTTNIDKMIPVFFDLHTALAEMA
jgi:anti-anti-sigma factor